MQKSLTDIYQEELARLAALFEVEAPEKPVQRVTAPSREQYRSTKINRVNRATRSTLYHRKTMRR